MLLLLPFPTKYPAEMMVLGTKFEKNVFAHNLTSSSILIRAELEMIHDHIVSISPRCKPGKICSGRTYFHPLLPSGGI